MTRASRLAAVVLAGVALAASAASAPAQDAARVAAAQLAHGAVDLLHSRPETPGRAGRVVALLEAAAALDADSPTICRMTADLHVLHNDAAAAAAALRRCVGSAAPDQDLAERWLQLELSTRQTAEARVELLRGLVDDPATAESVKADAAAALGRLRVGQKEYAEALAMFQRALRHDPHNLSALTGMLEMPQGVSVADRAGMVLRLHETRPRDVGSAILAAATLGELGLHDQALQMLDFAGQLEGERPSPAMLMARSNALLDAKQYQQAIDLLNAQLVQGQGFSDLYLPLVEAHLRLKQEEQRKPLIEAIEGHLRKGIAEGPVSADQAVQISWFYSAVKPDAAKAAEFAALAEKLQPDHPLTQRVLGAALLQAGKADEAIAKLAPLAPQDPFAAALLVKHYGQAGQKDEAARVLEASALASRSGPGARWLRQAAEEAALKVPAHEAAAAAAEAYAAGERIRRLTLAPQQAVKVTLAGTKEEFLPGEPIELVATLTNIADRAIPLGEAGLAQAVMPLRVVTGSGREFSRLPTVVFPGPRQLHPGRSVQTTLRIDVGELGDTLAVSPLARGSLTVVATFNPIRDARGRWTSATPTVPEPSAVLVRLPLIESPTRPDATSWRLAYTDMLARLEKGLKSDSLPDRILAGRQIGSLVCKARHVELGLSSMPEALADMSLKPDAIKLYQKALVDRSPLVRAQVIASLLPVSLSEELLKPLGPRLTDPSWLVRLRVCELIGASRSTGRKTVLDLMAADKAEPVQAMARAFESARP